MSSENLRREFLKHAGAGWRNWPGPSGRTGDCPRRRQPAGRGAFDVRTFGAPATARRSTRPLSTKPLTRQCRGRRNRHVPGRKLPVLLHPSQERHLAVPGCRGDHYCSRATRPGGGGFDVAEPNEWTCIRISATATSATASFGAKAGQHRHSRLRAHLGRSLSRAWAPRRRAWATSRSASRAAITCCCAISRSSRGHFGILATGIET